MVAYAALSTTALPWIAPSDKEGKRKFLLYVTALNYNDASVVLNSQYINAPIWGSEELHLTKICIIHQGTIGVHMKAVIASGSPEATSAANYIATPIAPNLITVDSDDFTIIEGDWKLDTGKGQTKTSYVNFLILTMDEYAATDDLYFVLEGWFK